MTDGNETKTERSPKTVWATVGAPKHLQRREKTRGTGIHEGLRSPRMDTKIQREGIDYWLSQSCIMVDRSIVGLAENQRRVRYFGFEATHEEAK
jgi:hypothetical protein